MMPSVHFFPFKILPYLLQTRVLHQNPQYRNPTFCSHSQPDLFQLITNQLTTMSAVITKTSYVYIYLFHMRTFKTERIGLSLVAFQLWGVLEQLAPEIFLNYFFKTGDLSMVQLTQKMLKSSKK